MRTGRACLFAATWIVCVTGYAGRPQFPAWRGGSVSLDIEWERASIVAVGDVDNVTDYGEQPVNGLPWPGSVGVDKLYWCEGDFQVAATLKGSLTSRAKKYLWPSPRPGCELYEHDPDLIASRYETRVWFLREEGGFLRPLYDGGGAHYFVGFCAAWDDGAPLLPRQRVGVFLLTPFANCAATADETDKYARYLENIGDLACILLGKEECVQRIRSLTHLGNASLRTAACDYLKGQQYTSCE